MPSLSGSAFARTVTDWLGAKFEKKRWTERETEKNDQVKTLIKKFGYLDPNDGHYYYEGVQPDGQHVRVQMIVKRPTFMDTDLAARLLEEKGSLEQFSQWQIEVTDDKLAAEALKLAGLDDGEHGFAITHTPTAETVREAYYEKLISDEQYAEIFTEEEQYSLYIRDGHK